MKFKNHYKCCSNVRAPAWKPFKEMLCFSTMDAGVTVLEEVTERV